MLKKISAIFLIFAMVLSGCQAGITEAEKKEVVNKLVKIVGTGDLTKLGEVVNAEVNPDVNDDFHFVNKENFYKVAVSDLEIEYTNDKFIFKNYNLSELVDKAFLTNLQIDGEDIEAKGTDEEVSQKYLENMQKMKQDMQKVEIPLALKFVREGKVVKLDFSDAETSKVLSAVIGETNE